MIQFNKPYLSGNEIGYIEQAILNGHISGNGIFTKKCHDFFTQKYGFKKCLLTTSCTDALEMAAILCDIQLGDEVIMPSYTFVSTANAFVLRGAKVVFADSREDHPGIDENKIESLVTSRTKVIVPVHYAGVACNMDVIMDIAKRYNLLVVEDAAQAIDSYYKGKPLGGIGHLGCFSFHETKNIQCGEGGMLVINDERFFKRAEIIWEKGTNRAEFFRGEVNKYGWVDIGSSFLPSEIIAAFLYAQLENLELIQKKRTKIWKHYYSQLIELQNNKYITLPYINEYASNNAHLFYLICRSLDDRNSLIAFLKKNNIHAVFHYLPLHNSEFYKHVYYDKDLYWSKFYSDRIIRLPLFIDLSNDQINYMVSNIFKYFKS
ncbi:MAG: dTDP-4-amino-4,6-dideoxygalactose transaminase [Bacteroidales bacterium]|nr:dTDP-4-amino-4,6-dideoxygalactose transaminase [Bacteroidales bacterium]